MNANGSLHIRSAAPAPRSFPATGLSLALGLALLSGTARAQSNSINFENAPLHPVDMTPDGTKLLVTNIADGTLEIFTLGGALPVWTASVPVGIDPVTVRARSNTEAWVVNQVSDSVSVVNLSTRNVVWTFKPGNEPCDVIFAGSPQRAYVSVSRENLLRVYDPANHAAAATTIALDGTCPRSLATDGTRIFAGFFEAGNRSIVVPRSVVSNPAGPWLGQNPPPNVSNGTFNPPVAPGVALPPTGHIMNHEGALPNAIWRDSAQVNWNSLINWGIHEHGVAIYTISTAALTYATNIDNINMGIAWQPGVNKITVVGSHLQDYVRFEPVNRQSFGRWFLGFFDPSNPPVNGTGNASAGVRDMNPQLLVNGVVPPYFSTVTPAQRATAIADTRAIVWNSTGATGYISGMGSGNVIRINSSGTRQAQINVGSGPTGMALDAARSRLYVYNRFDNSISSINTSTDAVAGTVTLVHDATPAAVKNGRPLHYDAHATSMLGFVSCNTCHIDTKSDAQAWDLGDPSASTKVFNQQCDAGTPFSGACNDWSPVKGPLMTQNLADTVGFGPLHWRGDREDVHAFTVGFTGLLGGSVPTDPQMQALADFFATLKRQPQPNRTITDTLPGSVPGFSGNPASGQALFAGPPIGGAVASCTMCHTQTTGGGLSIIDAATLGQSQGLKPPPLRDLYLKTGRDSTSLSSRRGFGFGHDGTFDSIFDLLQTHFANWAAGAAGVQQRRDLEAFLMCYPSGVHPAVGVQLTCDGTNNNDAATTSLLGTMTVLADSGNVGLIAKRVSGGLQRGYVYVPVVGKFQSDRLSETLTPDTLRTAAAAGSEVTFTVVALGTQTRLGVDRDGDGFFDRDELDAGSNPNDAASIPPLACRPTISSQPASIVVNTGDTITLKVTAGSAVTFQWRRAGVALSDGVGSGGGSVLGSTTSQLTIAPAGAADAGVYDCVITNGCGPTTSAGATVTVNTPTLCAIDYNADGSVNPDDLGDFITDYFTQPPVAGPGGYAIFCPGNVPPYDQGYRAGYTADGTGTCGEPNPDNLGDYITAYFMGC